MTLQAPPPSPAKSSMTPIIIVAVVGAIVIGVVFVGGILAALGVYGARRYLANAKAAEGKNAVAMIARGVVSCAAREDAIHGAVGPRGLPPSSHKVPASLAQVSGKKYMSTASDWTGDPAFACAAFEMSTPQYFQYQWELTKPGKEGVVHAVADLDGDGSPDILLDVVVTCSAPGDCSVGPLSETHE